jgi:hypothetical protein
MDVGSRIPIITRTRVTTGSAAWLSGHGPHNLFLGDPGAAAGCMQGLRWIMDALHGDSAGILVWVRLVHIRVAVGGEAADIVPTLSPDSLQQGTPRATTAWEQTTQLSREHGSTTCFCSAVRRRPFSIHIQGPVMTLADIGVEGKGLPRQVNIKPLLRSSEG